jgi:hypothetical protein
MDAMTVRRGSLYLGAFLVAAGGVTLLTSAGVLDPDRVVDVLAYWPVAVIAIGAALVLRRTSAAVPAGVIAAVTPGLLLGAMFVAVPNISTPCTGPASGGAPVTRQGTFGSTARVDLELSCGELAVTTGPGSVWSLEAANAADRAPAVTASADRLAVSSATHRVRFGWQPGVTDDWSFVLPTGTTLDLDTTINAGRGRLDLSGARLDTLGVDVNAGDMQVDLADATVKRMDVSVNAGATTIHLPATGGFTGSLEVNAGSLQVCVPETLGLRVTSTAALGSVDVNGLTRSGDAWVTPGYLTAQSRADLAVSASVGSVDINAEGVCK